MTVTAARQKPARECGRCAQLAPLARRARDGLPDLCNRCYRQLANQGAIPERLKRCDTCGEIAILQRSGRDGTPSMCERCYQRFYEEPEGTCKVCGRVRSCLNAGTDRAICRSCLRRSRRGICQDCGRDCVIFTRLNGLPQCSVCRRRDLASRGICRHCGQERRLTRITGLEGLCEPCAGVTSQHVCTRCRAEDHLYGHGLCARCVVATRLEPHIAAADHATIKALRPYLDSLLASSNPRSTLRWMHGSVAYQVLIELLAGRVALTHQALDSLSPSQAVEHLRRALVAHGALPSRDESLRRFNLWLDRTLAQITDPRERQHVTEWARWHLLNNLNYRSRRGQLKARSIFYARSEVIQATAFINWLTDQDVPLSDCRQGHVDCWFSERSTTRVRVTSLLRWAAGTGLTDQLSIPRADRPPAYRTLTDDQRTGLIARLVQDESLDLRDRVAGLLVLLYGQRIARLAQLRTTDIQYNDDNLLLRLGTEPVVVIDPLAGLLRRLADRPRGRAVTGVAPSTWLFPGKLVGQPLQPQRLQKRLRACGVKGLPSRASAVLELAREVPAPILAETLGYNHDLTAGWARLAAADYAAYAASRSELPATESSR